MPGVPSGFRLIFPGIRHSIQVRAPIVDDRGDEFRRVLLRPVKGVRQGGLQCTSTAFLLPNGRAASFIFATEDGTISAWNGGAASTILVDNSSKNAVYKGLAIGTKHRGSHALCRELQIGKIEVFGPRPPTILAGNFTDAGVPADLHRSTSGISAVNFMSPMPNRIRASFLTLRARVRATSPCSTSMATC